MTRNRSRVPTPPRSFDVRPSSGQWLHWKDVSACFWPGRGGRSDKVSTTLAPVRDRGGVYLLAWSKLASRRVHPTAPEIKYIGETKLFKRRMDQFRASAGFRGERTPGHSAGWRWPKGANEYLWLAFFEIGCELPNHLAEGMRCWMEDVALEEHLVANARLPRINEEEIEMFGETG